MREVQHDLRHVSWMTEVTVGFDNGIPIRKPLTQPHSRFYCGCGAVGGRTYGSTKDRAQSAAKRAHAKHVEEFDHQPAR